MFFVVFARPQIKLYLPWKICVIKTISKYFPHYFPCSQKNVGNTDKINSKENWQRSIIVVSRTRWLRTAKRNNRWAHTIHEEAAKGCRNRCLVALWWRWLNIVTSIHHQYTTKLEYMPLTCLCIGQQKLWTRVRAEINGELAIKIPHRLFGSDFIARYYQEARRVDNDVFQWVN